MTIEAWNVVLSAATLGVLTGGGIWLKYVVDQQLKAKDTAIGALEAVVKIKEAQIAVLKDDTAPAIAKAYADMRKHADLITDDSRRLSGQLAQLSQERQRDQVMAPVRYAVCNAHGMNIACDILDKHMGPTIGQLSKSDNPLETLFDAYMMAYDEILGKIQMWLAEARAKTPTDTPDKQLGTSAE